MAKKWKSQEITYLKRYASIRTTAELAERFGAAPDEVTDKLIELGLAAKDSVAPQRLEHDPLMEVLMRGTKALHGKKWKEARKHFEQVLAETDQVELKQVAERYLRICDEQLEPGEQEAEDPFMQAVYERNRGNLEAALDLCSRGGRQGKDERFAYLAAAVYSLQGENERAAQLLGTAIEMDPKNRIHALYDADFEGLRDDQEYAHIFEAD